jgi:hypothetical protein
LRRLSLVAPKNEKGLLAQAARDVAENVLDLVAEDDQDYDDHDSDQDEDKGVLDHTLPFLTVEQSAKLEIEAGQHASFTSLWRDRTDPVSHWPALKSTKAGRRNG